MSSCDQIRQYYAQKYNTSYCRGWTQNDWPGKIEDNWDAQIACVLKGEKKVAMTDYDAFSQDPGDIGELNDYYKQYPMDVQLRKDVLNCSVMLAYDRSGTHFWVYPQYAQNAQLLINHFDQVERFPADLNELIRSLLLGYSDESIVDYIPLLDVNDSRLRTAKNWIRQRGGLPD